MSLYQLQKAIYRYLNPEDGAPVPLEREAVLERFELSEREADAFLKADVPELHRLGIHPVLLNSTLGPGCSPASIARSWPA